MARHFFLLSILFALPLWAPNGVPTSLAPVEREFKRLESSTLTGTPYPVTPDQALLDAYFKVKRYDRAEQDKRRLRLEGGSFRTQSSAGPLDGEFMFVLTTDGRIIVDPLVVHEVHHSTLANGEPILCAGNLRFDKGKLVHVDNSSGHYQPPPTTLALVLRVLEQWGAPIDGLDVMTMEGRMRVVTRWGNFKRPKGCNVWRAVAP